MSSPAIKMLRRLSAKYEYQSMVVWDEGFDQSMLRASTWQASSAFRFLVTVYERIQPCDKNEPLPILR